MNQNNLLKTSHGRPGVTTLMLTCLLLFTSLESLATAVKSATQMKIVVVFGDPGHSSIHLQRNGEQLYWDPGGAYGTELDVCLQDSPVDYCERFSGFPWDQMKKNRDRDIFTGDSADLMRVISVYHLFGDDRIDVYTFDLQGDMADRAWRLLAIADADKISFDTDREPMFCVKGVTEYLAELGGPFRGIAHPWFPEDLGRELARLGMKPGETYTLRDTKVQDYIHQVRNAHGLSVMEFDFDRPVDTEIDEFADL